MRARRMKAIVWVGAVVALTAGCSKSESSSGSSSATPSAKPAAALGPVQPAVQAAAKPPPGPPIPSEPAVMTASITQDGKTCTATIDKDCIDCIRKEGKEL